MSSLILAVINKGVANPYKSIALTAEYLGLTKTPADSQVNAKTCGTIPTFH